MKNPMRPARIAAVGVSLALVLGAVAPMANAADETPVDVPTSAPEAPGSSTAPLDPETPVEPPTLENPENLQDPDMPTDPEAPSDEDTSRVGVPAVDPELTAEDVLLQELLAKHMEEALEGTSDADSALVVSVPGMKVDVPRDATTEDVSLKLGALPALTIEMPQDAVDASAPAVVEGTVVYGNEETGAVSSVQALETKAVRMAVSVPTPDAPQTYSFDLGLAEGMKAEPGLDGGIVVTTPITSDDTFNPITVGVPAYEIAAPWAKDANGVDVQTWYTLEGSTVTQHINPRPDHVYPIVMDPTIGESIDKVGGEVRELKQRLDNTSAAVTRWFNEWETLKGKVTGTESDILVAQRLKDQADTAASTAQTEYDRRIANRNRFARGTPTWNALDRGAAEYKRTTLDPARSSQATRKAAVDSLQATLRKHVADRDNARQRYNNNVAERATIAKSLDAKLALLAELKKAKETSTSGYTAKPTPEIPRLAENAKFCPSITDGADIKQEIKTECEKSAEDANTARLKMISAINDQNFWTARALEQVAEGKDASQSRANAATATGEFNRQYQAYWDAWNEWDTKYRKIIEANGVAATGEMQRELEAKGVVFANGGGQSLDSTSPYIAYLRKGSVPVGLIEDAQRAQAIWDACNTGQYTPNQIPDANDTGFWFLSKAAGASFFLTGKSYRALAKSIAKTKGKDINAVTAGETLAFLGAGFGVFLDGMGAITDRPCASIASLAQAAANVTRVGVVLSALYDAAMISIGGNAGHVFAQLTQVAWEDSCWMISSAGARGDWVMSGRAWTSETVNGRNLVCR
jgi:hypothetical protein